MSNPESSVSKAAGCLIIIAVAFLNTLAIQFAWNHMVGGWLESKRHMSLWNAFVLDIFITFAFCSPYRPKPESNLVDNSLEAAFRCGILWLTVWLAS